MPCHAKNLRRSLVVAAMLVLVSSNAFAECTADATAVNNWEGKRPGDADFFVKFKVTSEGCEGRCGGYVEYKLHYFSPRGTKFSESGMARWSMDGDEQSSVEVVDETEAALCDEIDQDCEFIDTEITEVSCRD